MSIIEQNIRRQSQRGEFAYWEPSDETQWITEAPERPESRDVFQLFGRSASTSGLTLRANRHAVHKSEYDQWNKMLESGRNYMVGDDVPMNDFIKSHRSTLRDWMQKAFVWCNSNQYFMIDFSTPGRDWKVYKRGEFVVFELPHHDAGGEKMWISQDGKTRILINVD